MINTHKSSKKNIENQRNSYTIKIIKHFEKDNINENKKKDNECLSFFNSKSINDINNAKNILDNFLEKKNQCSIDQKNSLFCQSKKSINKRNNKSSIFYEEPLSPIQKYWKNYNINNNNNNNFSINLIKFTEQLYENEEHFKKNITLKESDKNEPRKSKSKSRKINYNLDLNKKENSRKYSNYSNKNNYNNNLNIIYKFSLINNTSKGEEKKSKNSNNNNTLNNKLKLDKRINEDIPNDANNIDKKKNIEINKDNKILKNDINIHKNKNIEINIKKCNFFCCLNSDNI